MPTDLQKDNLAFAFLKTKLYFYTSVYIYIVKKKY